MYYFLTWNGNWYFTERIKKWSTIEYIQSGGKWITYDFFLTISGIILFILFYKTMKEEKKG